MAIISVLVSVSACVGPYPYIAGYRTNPDGSVCKIVLTDPFNRREECGPPPYIPPTVSASQQQDVDSHTQQQEPRVQVQDQSQPVYNRPMDFDRYPDNGPRHSNIPPVQEQQPSDFSRDPSAIFTPSSPGTSSDAALDEETRQRLERLKERLLREQRPIQETQPSARPFTPDEAKPAPVQPSRPSKQQPKPPAIVATPTQPPSPVNPSPPPVVNPPQASTQPQQTLEPNVDRRKANPGGPVY